MVEEWTHEPNLDSSNLTTKMRRSQWKGVENMTKNPNFKGSNPTTDTEKEKVAKVFYN